jgi:hypothetical protein
MGIQMLYEKRFMGHWKSTTSAKTSISCYGDMIWYWNSWGVFWSRKSSSGPELKWFQVHGFTVCDPSFSKQSSDGCGHVFLNWKRGDQEFNGTFRNSLV